MKTRTKIISFMFLALIFYGAFIIYLGQFNTEQIKIILDESKQQKTVQLDKLMNLFTAQQQFLTNDASIWDDTLSFIKTKDRDFSAAYLDASLSIFDVNQLWVYNTNNNLVYSTYYFPDGSKSNYTFSKDVLEQLFQKRITNFFIETPNGIMQIYGATVHPSNDPERKTVPGGYFFSGRLIDTKTLNSLSDLIGGTVSLRLSNVRAPESDPNKLSTFLINKPLKDWSGKDSSYIDVEVLSLLAEELSNSSASFLRISTIFGGISLLILFLLLYLYVSRPLQILSESLSKKKTEEIKIMEHETGEFGQLAIMIDQFFDQQIKIEQEKARSDALLESINDSIIGINRNWDIVFLNKAASALIGLSLEQVSGKPFRDLIKIIRSRDRSEYITYIEDAFLYGKPTITEDEIFVVTKNGNEIPVTSSAATIFDANKKSFGAVIVIHDISKERESQLLRSDFTYASHQLRTPVTEATWAITEALEVKDVKDKDRNLRVAEHSLKSVHKLVEHLLEVSHVDQNTIIPEFKKIKLIETIKSVADIVNIHAKERKININLPKGIASQTLNTDGSLLQRVIFEILDNAVSYAKPETEVSINVVTQSDGLSISIQNIGTTILEDQLPLVFTKFFRGAEAPEMTPGAGLGLYIAREYLKLLKGKIWFTSEKGITTFFVFVPLA